MTLAKSLTGVGQHGRRRLAPRQPRESSADDEQRRQQRGRSAPRAASCAPSIDVVPDSLPCIEVAREERRRLGDRGLAAGRRREDFADEANGYPHPRLGYLRERFVRQPGQLGGWRATIGQPRDVAIGARAEGRRRARSTARSRVASPWDSRNPSRRWMTWLLACASQARRRSSAGIVEAGEGVAPPYDRMRRANARVFQREDVDRASQLGPRQHQRHRKAPTPPAVGQWQARRQVPKGEPLDEGKRVQHAIGIVAGICHQRLEARTEDAFEVPGEGVERALLRRRPAGHRGIISFYNLWRC